MDKSRSCSFFYCDNKCYKQFSYCSEHIQEISNKNTKLIVYTLIADLLSVDYSKVSDESNIYDDLEADSLDAVEIVMEIESFCDIIITDESAEKLKIVRDINQHVCDLIASEEKFIEKIPIEINLLREKLQIKDEYSKKSLNALTGNEHLSEVLGKLGLLKSTIIGLLSSILKGNLIRHITIMPQLKKTPSHAHLFILTKELIFHFHINSSGVKFNKASIRDVSFTYQFIYNKNNKIDTVHVECKFVNSTLTETLKFSFRSTNEIKGTMEFMRKQIKFSEEVENK